MSVHSQLFFNALNHHYSGDNKKKKPWTKEELDKIAAEILQAKRTPGKKTRRQYHLLSLYNVLEVGGQMVVTKKVKKNEENFNSIVAYEDLFNILHETHINVGHGGRDKMMYALKAEYEIGRYPIEKFIDTCEVCQKKKNKSHANLTIKPIISTDFNSRGQVDLMDFQSCPDNDFNWLLNYQDHLTKFLFLRPLKTKSAAEVAKELLKIFLEIGAPGILQSDNGREFTASIISEMVKVWPSLKILHGRPRHPQSQGSVERSNQDVEKMLRAWMYDNQTKNWSMGCYFVQFQKNSSYHKVIGRTPYRALFGVDPKVGFATKNVPRDLLEPIENEEDLLILLKETGVHMEVESEANIETEQEITIEIDEVENAEIDEADNIEIEEVKNMETEFESEVNGFNDENNQQIIKRVMDVSNSETENIPSNEKLPNEETINLCLTCPDNGGKCVLCKKTKLISENRQEAGKGQKRAAEKMLSNTMKKLPPLNIGSGVLLPVDKIDRGPFDMQNLLCIVTDYKNGVYQVGCKAGRIKSWFNRPDLINCKENLISADDIPNKFLSVRECVQVMSLSEGQGYFKCSCKPAKKQCLSNRCICFKKKVLCNSRCHKSGTCANK